MKRTWLLTVFILWVLNLFFLGIMIGRAYQHSQLQKGFYHASELSAMEKVKFFTSETAGASKWVLRRLNDKWRTVINYAKHTSKFGFIIKHFRKRTKAGIKIVQAPIIIEPGKESVSNRPISHLEANIPFTLDNYLEDRPRNRTSGRPDPFLEIVSLPKNPQPTKNKPIIKTDDPKESNLVIGLKEEPQKTNPLSKTRLRGIVLGKTRVAYIEDPKGYQRITVGSSISGGKVIDITKEGVTVQMGNQQFTLTEEGSN